MAGDKIIIVDDSGLMGDEFLYQLDYLKDVKVNIAEIKNHLQKYYPVFYDIIEKKISQEEIQEMISKGIDYNDIINNDKNFEKVKRYQLIRVINQCNEINVWDFLEKKIKFFKLSIPVVSFMEEVYHDVQSAYRTFLKTAKLVEFN